MFYHIFYIASSRLAIPIIIINKIMHTAEGTEPIWTFLDVTTTFYGFLYLIEH